MILQENGNPQWVLTTAILILASAFITNAIIMLLCHYNPLEAYQAAVSGAFGTGQKIRRNAGEKHTVSDDRTFSCNSVSMWNLEYRCRRTILGRCANGDMVRNKTRTNLFPETPWIAVPICLCLATFAGGIWGLIPSSSEGCDAVSTKLSARLC